MLEILDLKTKTYRVSPVALKRAPIMMCYINHIAAPVVLDTGAENNVIGDVTCRKFGLKILQTCSQAQQVDKSPLKSVGRVLLQLENGNESWTFDGLVCAGIGDIILAGNPFLEQGINPVTYKNQIEIVTKNGHIRTLPWRPVNPVVQTKPQVFLLKAEEKVTIYPDEFVELKVPSAALHLESSEVMITPRLNSKVKMVDCLPTTHLAMAPKLNDMNSPFLDQSWPNYELVPFPPPQLSHIVGGTVRIKNSSPLPIIKNHHIADIKSVQEESQNRTEFDPKMYPKPKPSVSNSEVSKICLDPDNLLQSEVRELFKNINEKYSDIFMSKPGRYNGVLGNLDAKLVLGSTEPPSFPCKRIVQSEKLDDIKQEIMDQMEADGLLARPEDVGVQVTHVHESYLVPKMEDGTVTGEYRLVTNLQSLSPYLKPTRIPLPTIDEAFRKLGKWRFIILMDLRSWHWQIPVAKSSMRYLGTSTPYGGDRVYTVQPQGYLNATENADRVILRVLEPAIKAKKCIRMADNMIVGGSTPEEAAEHYELVLKLCGGAGLTFKAGKTVICPRRVNILGKVWENGVIKPSDHLSATLAKVSPPVTVKQMRSFLGGAKQMKENLPNYSELFHPLEKSTAGRKSAEKIVWNEELRDAFRKVQKAVENPDFLALARPQEKLFIYPDWSDENQSGGAPLYIFRDLKWLKVRNFTQRLKAARKWSPCEGEAWMIRVAVENHGPWISQSGVSAEINTDSAACVLSFQRLRRGQFSRSVRVAFLLSTLAEFNVYLVHRAGSNHPGDYDSRHAVDCTLGTKCQVCIFAHDLAGPTAQEVAHPSNTRLPMNIASKKLQLESQAAAVSTLSVDDILSGRVHLPFTQRSGWKNIQDEDKTIQTLRRHMQGGTIPQRRGIKQPELKKLYNLFQHQKITISQDGLVVKVETDNIGNVKQQIVVPNIIMKGIITALHIKFDHPHPSSQELKTVSSRYWYSTKLNQIIQEVWDSCHLCQALKPVPKEIFEQTTTESGRLGSNWSADVIRGDLQFIFIAREKLSSFTVTKIIPNETHETLREAIITSTSEIIPEDGLLMQVDNACSLLKLVGDAELGRHHIRLDPARKKNKDSNPIGEKAVKEFRQEKLRFKPEGGAISEIERAVITASLNKKIRNRGVSSKEIIMNRDQNTLMNLNLNNEALAAKQLSLRLENHPQSEKCKSKKGVFPFKAKVWPGALVLLKKDLSKLRGRELYIVVKIDDEGKWCWIKKSVKQLRAENYKIKTTEICLAPNQTQPTDDATDADNDDIVNDLTNAHCPEEPFNDVKENEETKAVQEPAFDTKKYSLRRKPKPDYKSMHQGTSVKFAESKKPIPPRFGWDTESSSSDEEDPHCNTITQFSNWCSRQSTFVPKSSIFLHWFRDKYPSMDIIAFENRVKDFTQNIAVPISSSSSVTDKMDTGSNTSDNNIRVLKSGSKEHFKSKETSRENSEASELEDDVFENLEAGDEIPFMQSPDAPTARSSSTNFCLLSIPSPPFQQESLAGPSHQLPPPTHSYPTTTAVPTTQPQDRINPVIICPSGSCNISEVLPYPSDVISSPPPPLQITRANYPTLFQFAESRPPDGPLPEEPHELHHERTHREGLRQRQAQVDYQSLHNYGRGGQDAWKPE